MPRNSRRSIMAAHGRHCRPTSRRPIARITAGSPWRMLATAGAAGFLVTVSGATAGAITAPADSGDGGTASSPVAAPPTTPAAAITTPDRYVAATVPGLARLTDPHRAQSPRASRSAFRHHLRLHAMSPRQKGRLLAARVGWVGDEWRCLDDLWTRESNWQVHDTNASSGAYGIPQALPATKMAWAGDNWRDSGLTQIRWGLHYIDERYGTPCAAWAHSENYGYY